MKTHHPGLLIEVPVPTSLGRFTARYSRRGLAELNFPKTGPVRRTGRSPRQGIPANISRWHRATAAALKNILDGRKPKCLPPLDLTGGTKFQRDIWRTLRRIPRGKTRSYGEIARQTGKPRAVRAVGGACGANPIPVFVPCHRVLAANGKPGGYSGGLDRKRRLLAREGIKF